MVPMLLCHFYFLKERAVWGKIYEGVFNNGGFSVTFFILLSGFVVTLGYKDKFTELTKEAYIDFIKSRVHKFYPLYCVTMIYAFLYEVLLNGNLGGENLLKLLNVLTMSQTLTVKYYDAFNAALWYISCLFVLYLVTPLFLRFLSYKKNRMRTVVIMIIVLYFGVLAQIKLFELITAKEIFTYRNSFILFYGTPYSRIFPYFIGGGMAVLFEKLNGIMKGKKFVLGTVTEIFAIVCAIGVYFWGITKEKYIYANWLYIPVLAAVIFVFAFQQGKISQFLSNEWQQRLGKFSMYLYMTHYIVINCGGSRLLDYINTGNEVLDVSIVFIAVCFLIFIASYGAFLYMKKGYFRKKRG